MRAKADYRRDVSMALASKVPGEAVPSLLNAHEDVLRIGLRARVHPRACAGVIALRGAEEELRRGEDPS